MIARSLLIASALALAPTAVLAQAAPATPATPATPDPDANKKICRTLSNTGTRLSRNRQCLTQAQWDKLALDAREELRRGRPNGTGRQ